MFAKIIESIAYFRQVRFLILLLNDNNIEILSLYRQILFKFHLESARRKIIHQQKPEQTMPASLSSSLRRPMSNWERGEEKKINRCDPRAYRTYLSPHSDPGRQIKHRGSYGHIHNGEFGHGHKFVGVDIPAQNGVRVCGGITTG